MLLPDRTTSTTPNPPEINSTPNNNVIYDFDDWTQHFHEGFTNQNISLSIIDDTYSNNTYNNTQNNNNDNNTCISSRKNSHNYDTSQKGRNYDPFSNNTDDNDDELYKDFEYINKPILVSKEKLLQLEIEFQKKSQKIQKKNKLKNKKLIINNNNIILNKQVLENKAEEIHLKRIYTENIKTINEYIQKSQNYDQQVINIQNEINANRKLVKGIHKKLKDIQLLQDKLNNITAINTNIKNNTSSATTATATNASNKNTSSNSSKNTTNTTPPPPTTTTPTSTIPTSPLLTTTILTPEQIDKLNQKDPLTNRLIELEALYTQLLSTQSSLIPPSPLSPDLQRLLDEEKAKDSGTPLPHTTVENKHDTKNSVNNTDFIQTKSAVASLPYSTDNNGRIGNGYIPSQPPSSSSATAVTNTTSNKGVGSVWDKPLPPPLTPAVTQPTPPAPITSSTSTKKTPPPIDSEPIIAIRGGPENNTAKPENGTGGGGADDDWQPIISARSNKKKHNKI